MIHSVFSSIGYLTVIAIWGSFMLYLVLYMATAAIRSAWRPDKTKKP